MRVENLTVEDFKRFVPRVKCINLFHYKLIGTQKLSEVGKVERLVCEGLEDLECLRDDRLAWYVNQSGGPVFWDAPGARNLTVGEQAERHRANPDNQNLSQMIDGMRGGLSMDVELILVHDTTLNVRVIVDGIYRALALFYLYKYEPETAARILSSGHSVSCVVFSSRAGALLFPCDFINICRDLGPAP